MKPIHVIEPNLGNPVIICQTHCVRRVRDSSGLDISTYMLLHRPVGLRKAVREHLASIQRTAHDSNRVCGGQVCQLSTLPFSSHVFPLRRNGSSFHPIATLKMKMAKSGRRTTPLGRLLSAMSTRIHLSSGP